MVTWSSGDAGERGGIPPPVSPPCHRFGRWGRGAVFGSAFIVAGDGDSTAGIGSIPDPETGGAGGAALIIQIAIDPGGGCLKQIDPALALPRNGVKVQVRPWLQQDHYELPGDRGANLEGADRPDSQCPAVFWCHASRSMRKAPLPIGIISNHFVTARVALSMTDQLQARIEKRSRYWPKYARLAR